MDHNLLQEDHKNADDHLFLRSACRRFGLWYSPAGSGVSHPVHMECFGRPGRTLLGSDSHTPAAGALGMLAMGAGGLEAAMAIAGEPYRLSMLEIWGVRFLESVGRSEAWQEILADPGASYDLEEEIDLATLEPLIAKPSSPGNVVPVRELAGEGIYQAYIGSSANPGYRDFAVPALMVEGKRVADGVSFDVNPTSRRLLGTLIRDGHLARLVRAGGRLHQAGCNGCIGMGQAPATGRNSLRTVPRNFPGRSGTREDSVFLCSPETAAASALAGRIVDPRDLGIPYPHVGEPRGEWEPAEMLVPPLPPEEATAAQLERGPNIV